MAKCEVCGKDHHLSFDVIRDGTSYTFARKDGANIPRRRSSS